MRHPHKAVAAPSPRRLGGSAEEAQLGATRPERGRVALGNEDDLELTLVLLRPHRVLPRTGKMGRESPEIPVALGVDGRHARPGRGCRNGQHGDLVLSQGGTRSRTSCVTSFRSATSVFVTYGGTALQQPGSAHALPPATEDFDMVNAMTNLVVQAVRKMDRSSWLPLRGSDYADHLGAKTKAVILGVAHGGAVLDILDTRNPRVG